MVFTSWNTPFSETSLLTTFSKELLSLWTSMKPFRTSREVVSPFSFFGRKSKASPVFYWFIICATNFHDSIRLLIRHKSACYLQCRKDAAELDVTSLVLKKGTITPVHRGIPTDRSS